MRLVHLAGYGGPYAGSFIPMLRAVMRAAQERGWSRELVFSAVARDRPWLEELRADDIPFQIAPAAARSELTGLVRSLVASSGPTILHSHFTTFDVPCVRAARGRDDVRVMWHVHTPHGNSLSLRVRNLFKYGVVGRGADRILCVSPELVDVVTSRGARRDRVAHLPNAVDADRFPLISDDGRSDARRHLGLDARRRVLVHFGWDWERKGGDLFCAAVAQLRARGLDVIGLTVGSPERAVQAARALGLGPDVLSVQESRDDVRVFYGAADVFVAPSRAEGTPYSVLEALSCGAAVVASEIPGHVEIGREVHACRLTGLDGGAVADAAAGLLDRAPAQVEGDARAAHEWVRRERDLAAWTEALMRCYDTVALTRNP